MRLYQRYEGESEDELIYRICSEKDLIGTWYDVAEILNDLLNQEYTESRYRKMYQDFARLQEANSKKFADSIAQFEEITVQRRLLEQEKVKFRDERRAWAQQNYTDGRVAENLDLLSEKLSEIGRLHFSENTKNVRYSATDKAMIVMLSDMHIGQTFNSMWGEYNTDIAKRRLDQYLDEVIKLQELHQAKNCYLISLGDQISGLIHQTLCVTNREQVIDQVKIAIELISSFAKSLCHYFDKVFFTDVSGNHSRIIANKNDALHNERLDELIGWTVGQILEPNEPKFHLLTHRKLDIGMADINVCGKTYIAVHGDFDNFSKSGIGDLSLMLGFTPYGILCGHKHSNAFADDSNVRLIRGGTLAGSGDDFTIEHRMIGHPSQMVVICSERGIEALCPIDLD